MSETITSKPCLTLIRQDSIFYPAKEDDHILLSSLKIPIIKISTDYFPILEMLCKRKKIKIKVKDFESLELAMMAKVKAKWKYEMIETQYSLVFQYPRNLKVNTSTMIAAIQDWYRRNSIKTEIITKKTSKSYRILVKKVRA